MPENIYDWIGKKQITEDEISTTLVRRAAAMVDLDPEAFRRGDELPPHWYSMFFTPNARASEIGHDGHPRKGDFLPPIPLPRRMFVGREVKFIKPLVIGSQARKVSEIASITPKSGRSGKLVFLQVKHTIETEDGSPALIETQNVVYREALPASGDPPPAQAPSETLSPAFDWSEEHLIDSVTLYRYSALTWNGHRIHYDCDYARNNESYPSCVMNGGLTLHLLIGAALKQAPGLVLKGLHARLSSPLFVGDTLKLTGASLQPAEQGWIMPAVALNGSGRTAASIELFFDEQGA